MYESGLDKCLEGCTNGRNFIEIRRQLGYRVGLRDREPTQNEYVLPFHGAAALLEKNSCTFTFSYSVKSTRESLSYNTRGLMMGDNSSFLHVSRPLTPAIIGAHATTSPVTVVIQPQALFSILDHSLRRPKDQDRVIGTLLGHRSDDGGEISVQNCYAVPHTETAEQVEVDMDYQKTMLSMHLRANPKEVLVGWYATSSELNTFSALIQNFYGQQGDGTFPYPAVHLTVSTEAGQPPESRAYISAPIGVTAERAADSCSFIPVPHEIRYGEAEKSGLELISSAKQNETRTTRIVSDIEALENSIEQVLEMVERVANYVSNVLDEEAEPNAALGQFLLNALSLAPKVEPVDIEKDL